MKACIADWPSNTTAMNLCPNCRNATTVICWDTAMNPQMLALTTSVYCPNCCPHYDHEIDERQPINDDNVDKKRVVEVLCVFEITGTKQHADKLTAKVKKEMRVQFGNLYKEDM